MARFKVRMKLQGFELEVDGEREDIGAISSAVQQQLAGLVQPSESMVDGKGTGSQLAPPTIDGDVFRSKKNRKKSRPSGDPGGAAQPIEFRHDGARFGSAIQAWSATEKCIWLLYVLKHSASTNEASGAQIAATFNQYFKPAGRLHPPNVPMILAKAKMQTPPPVGDDRGNWFITEEGERVAAALIAAIKAK